MKQPGNTKGKSTLPPNQSSGTLPSQPFAPTDMAPVRWWANRHPLEWALLPLRLFLGVTFVYAGIQKLTDPQFFNPLAINYIGKQIIAFAHGSPLHDFLIKVVVPHSHFFGAVIIAGEIAIGLGTLFGFFFRPAAFFGMLLSLMFFLSASWHVYPYFYGADIVFVFAWITMILAGPLHSVLPSLDGVLVPRFLSTLSPQMQGMVGRVSQVLLGVGNEHVIGTTGQAIAVQGAYPPVGQRGQQAPTYNSNVNGYPQGVPYQVMNNQGRYQQGQQGQQQRQSSYKAQIAAQRRSMENRRNFLWGLVAGGVGMLTIIFAGKAINLGGDNSAVQTTTNNGGTSGGTQTTPASGTGTSTGAGSSNAIAQVSAVPKNSAVTFTIPSNGDPGVLVHLNNDKFVCFDATCTHAGCPVSFDPGSSYLVCPCHGAEFDPANNASVIGGPAPSPLTSVPIDVNSSTGAITLK